MLGGIGLALVLAFFLAFVSPDPMVVVCISPLAFPPIFAVAYLFLAPTFPVVYRSIGPSARTISEHEQLRAELETFLDRGESLVASTTGGIGEIPAVLALTTRRLVFDYAGNTLAFRHAEIDWLRWSPFSATLSFFARPVRRKTSMVVGGAHWKVEAEQLAHSANSRYGISPSR